MTLLPDVYLYASILFWVVWAYSATRKPATLPKVIQSNITDSAESQSESHARFAIVTNISFVVGLLRLAIVFSHSCARKSLTAVFSLSEKSTGIGKPRYSKSLLILCAYPCAVADRELQSSIKFLMKQAMIRSYPGSLPQGLGINLSLHNFKYWACLNRSVSIAEPCLSRASFGSIKRPKSLRAALDSAGRNNNASIPHSSVEVWRSRI